MLKEAIQHGKPLLLPKEYTSLSEMVVYIAEKYPDKGMTFVDFSGEEEFCSYSSLVYNALKYLKNLSQKGLKSGDIVILEINNPKEFYFLFWACIFGGIIVAPVSQPTSLKPGSDHLLKLFNIWRILKKPPIVVEEKYHKYYKILEDSPEYSGISFISSSEFNSYKKGKMHHVRTEDLAVLQFSSGSTGNPKGVQLNHKNILNNIFGLSRCFNLTEADQVFMWVPHTHDMGLFGQYLTSMISGCNIFIFSPSTFIRSPYLFLKKMKEHKGTWFASPNFGLDWIVKNIPDEKLPSLDLSSLRFISNGAEPISVSVIKSFV
jgi:acyl-CoA synthetase (AMP-forming)/AMP-acid ligase II